MVLVIKYWIEIIHWIIQWRNAMEMHTISKWCCWVKVNNISIFWWNSCFTAFFYHVSQFFIIRGRCGRKNIDCFTICWGYIQHKSHFHFTGERQRQEMTKKNVEWFVIVVANVVFDDLVFEVHRKPYQLIFVRVSFFAFFTFRTHFCGYDNGILSQCNWKLVIIIGPIGIIFEQKNQCRW